MSQDVITGPAYAGWRAPSPWERLRCAVGRLRYRYFPPKSNMESWAERELARLLGDPDGDEMQVAMNKHLLKMVREFGREGHSGFSAGYAVSLLQKLLRLEPVTPLTGEEGEWNDIGDISGEPMWQNNRCGRVFKGADGRAYDIDGIVFIDPDGLSYTSSDSRVFVTFPYTPTTLYQEVGAATDGDAR